jgi:hypothetical protein
LTIHRIKLSSITLSKLFRTEFSRVLRIFSLLQRHLRYVVVRKFLKNYTQTSYP